jgi:hypothetical protein
MCAGIVIRGEGEVGVGAPWGVGGGGWEGRDGERAGGMAGGGSGGGGYKLLRTQTFLTSSR